MPRGRAGAAGSGSASAAAWSGTSSLLSGVTVLVVSVVAYLRATDDLTSAIYERLDAVAENKTASLGRWLDEQTPERGLRRRAARVRRRHPGVPRPGALGGRPLGRGGQAARGARDRGHHRPPTRRSS